MTKKSIPIWTMGALLIAALLAATSSGLDLLEQTVRKDQAALAQPTPGEINRAIAEHEQGIKDAHAALRGANAAGKMVYINQLKETARRNLAYHQAALEALKGQ